MKPFPLFCVYINNRKMKDKGGFCYEKEMVNNHNGVHGLIVHCGNGLSVYNGEKNHIKIWTQHK